MKKILLTIILLFAVSNVYAGEHYYVKGFYTKDIISLDIVCESIFDDDDVKFNNLYRLGTVKIVDDRIEVRDVKIIPKEEAFVELPSDMVEFKLMDDYRTYYTLDNLLTRVFK